MSILSTEQFMEQSDDVMISPSICAEKKVRMNSALTRNGRLPDSFVIPTTQQYIESLTGISLSTSELQEMLAMYPAEKAKLARYTMSDFIHSDLVKLGKGVPETYLIANIVAHFFGSTLWPTPGNLVDRKAFVRKLQRCAMRQGYTVGGCTLEKLSA
jgi:hypothetical protein